MPSRPSTPIAAGSREPGANGSQSSLYTVGLGVTAWELDFFGRVRSLSDAALSQFYATEEARKAAQISLIAAVANAQLAVQADDELIASTRRTLATREDSLKLTKLKFDNGAASELDLRQAESLLEGANATLAQQRRQRALDENALVLLIGQSLPADLPPAVPLAEQRLLATLPAGLPSDLLDRRPDVRQAEQQLIAANANIGAARAAFLPRITLTGTVGIVSTELSSLFSDGTSAGPSRPSCCCRSSTPAATRPTCRSRRSTATSPSRSTRRRSRPRSAKWPTRSPAAPRWASSCVPSRRRHRPRRCAIAWPTCAIATARRATSTCSTRSARCSPHARPSCRCSCSRRRTW